MGLLRILLAALSLPALAVLAACGGDDGSGSPASDTPRPSAAAVEQTYFDDLVAAIEPISEESQSLNDFRATAFDENLPEEERAANAQEFATRYEEFAQSAHDALAAITPGESLSRQHGDLVDALAGLANLGRDIATALETEPVSTEQQFGDLFFQLDGQSLELRVRDACFDLQSAANEQGGVLTIACPR